MYFDTNNFWYISKWCSHVRHLVVVIFIGPELLARVTECGLWLQTMWLQSCGLLPLLVL